MQPMEKLTYPDFNYQEKLQMSAPKKDFTYKIVNTFISILQFCTTAALKILSRGTLQCSGKKCYPNSILYQNKLPRYKEHKDLAVV